jgi:hypothetical protein
MKLRLMPTLEFVVEFSDEDKPHMGEIAEAMRSATTSRGLSCDISWDASPPPLELHMRITLSGEPPEVAIRTLVRVFQYGVLPRFRALRRKLRARAAEPAAIPDRKLTIEQLGKELPELRHYGIEWRMDPPDVLHRLLVVGDTAIAHAHVDSLERIVLVTDAVVRNNGTEIVLNIEPRGGRAQAIVLKKIETLPKPIAPSKKA